VEGPGIDRHSQGAAPPRAIEREDSSCCSSVSAPRGATPRPANRVNWLTLVYFAIVSHELAGPLKRNLGWDEVARLQKPSARSRARLEVIVRNARFSDPAQRNCRCIAAHTGKSGLFSWLLLPSIRWQWPDMVRERSSTR